MWLERRLPKRQPECLVAIETAARSGCGLVLMSLDVGKGQARVEAKLRSDGLKDVPAGCKSFVREFWVLSGSNLLHCLENCQVITPISVGGSGLL
jgi:hypothetical protein